MYVADAVGAPVTLQKTTVHVPFVRSTLVPSWSVGSEPSEPAIRSDFPEISISRREGVVRGTGTVNGGGEKVRIETTSGTIRLRRGPAAGK